MSGKSPFRFQQFTVRDDHAAMKIGTDAVLLGAWAPTRGAKRILDVGTGCGIIALMLAQRTNETDSRISAIDIDSDAASQAVENFAASPWPGRLPSQSDEVQFSLEEFSQPNDRLFDLVVCNPPFFSNASLSPSESRSAARHAAGLPRDSLFELVFQLLTESGRFCLVLPFEQADSTIALANEHGFHLWSRTNVRPTPTSDLKRVLLEFGRESFEGVIEESELIVEMERHQYSSEYADLTKHFHLRYG